jgi:type II secretory pathway component PulM
LSGFRTVEGDETLGANKFGQAHVYIIGVVVMLIVGGGLFWFLIRPIQENTKKANQELTAEKAKSVQVDGASFTNAQLAAAKTKLTEQDERYKDSKATLDTEVRRKQLPPNEQLVVHKERVSLIGDSLPRWFNLPKNVVTRMEAFSKRLAAKHGVEVQTQFSGPAPATTPNAIERTLVAWPLGPMRVTGEFKKVMAWARGWNDAPLLSVVEPLPLSLAGRGGKVTSTVNLTVFVFPTGNGIVEPVAGAGSSAGAFGGGGAFGGAGDPSMMGGAMGAAGPMGADPGAGAVPTGPGAMGPAAGGPSPDGPK